MRLDGAHTFIHALRSLTRGMTTPDGLDQHGGAALSLDQLGTLAARRLEGQRAAAASHSPATAA